MAAQSRTKTILLTRPDMQAMRFAELLQWHFTSLISIIFSPLLRTEFLTLPIAGKEFDAVIFTSQTAVEAARRMPDGAASLPRRAYCVGEQTAKAAMGAGFDAISAGSNAAGLLEMLKPMRPSGRLLHLRGEISLGAVAESLNSAGIETFEAIVYGQIAQPLNEEALGLLRHTEPVFVPLFSPRSARLFSNEIAVHGSNAPLFIAALSPAVAQETVTLASAALEIAESPDAAGMIGALSILFATPPGP